MTRLIMHVEDDPDIREIVRIAIEFSDEFDVVQSEDGPSGLEALQSVQPDILLLDVMMPGMNGMEFLTQARESGAVKDVPAIFMTARVQEVEIQPLYDVGGVGVISKPFDPITLGEQINEIIARA